ncbi:hypothetical protein [Helicobacter cetorum]|uniref:Uncharacterized protein n=1 Tax=Helicobacter cetorum (strain ATCC BAA-429 / MIT 00-7128) TaxID=182217 RepID=I0EL72_HELC0|nr:hypothetical protein [Helicobacter cetorum]AFI03691.1 hypothetical protein HCW_02030 [Helicobacter cetorum MIT 00-7128]
MDNKDDKIDEEFILEPIGAIRSDQIRDYFNICDEILSQKSNPSITNILLERKHTLHFCSNRTRIDFVPKHIQSYLINTMKKYHFTYRGEIRSGISFHQTCSGSNNYKNLKECVEELMHNPLVGMGETKIAILSLSW